MTSIAFDPLLLLLGSLVVVLILLVVFNWYRFFRLNLNVSKKLIKLEKQLKIITSGAIGMGERMIKLESELNMLRENGQQAFETETQYSYSQAKKLIEQGVDASTIATNCGLSDSEIQLMQLVHQNGQQLRFG